MKRGWVRAVLLLVCAAALLAAVPVSAAGGSASLANAKAGSVVTFGRYEQDDVFSDGTEDLEWIVLEKKADKALLISRYIIERIVYDSEGGDYGPAWSDSGPCLWLNGEFLRGAFTAAEQNQILKTTVANEAGRSQDKLFLLSAAEAKKYFKNDAARKAQPTKSCRDNFDWQAYRAWEFDEYEALSEEGRKCWLLRPDGYFCDVAVYVDQYGAICECYGNGLGEYINGVRPAMWVSTSGAAGGTGTGTGAAASGDYPATYEELQYYFDYEYTGPRTTRTGTKLTLPKASSFLRTPFRARLNNTRYNIYIMPKPQKGNGNLGQLYAKKEVWILASENGFYFFYSDDGEIGWNGQSYFKRLD